MIDAEIEQKLPVMEAFYTLQGEGFYTGHAAYFIRLGGCDVGCVWCDVKDSWDVNAHPTFTVKQIVHKMLQEVEDSLTKPIVVITGGEPLMHDLTVLTSTLQSLGFLVNIETSGSSVLTGNYNWICLSPKKFKAPLPSILPLANELKIVVFNQSDFDWAEKHATLVSKSCKLYLQPEWDKAKQVTPQIIAYIKQNPQWQLSLQTHKYLNIP
jgi:7-carboxy-7-deazaguanine synthase